MCCDECLTPKFLKHVSTFLFLIISDCETFSTPYLSLILFLIELYQYQRLNNMRFHIFLY